MKNQSLLQSIENEPGLVRDVKTQAILLRDKKPLEEYNKQRQERKLVQSRINTLEERVASLEEKFDHHQSQLLERIAEINCLLLNIINQPKG